MSLIIVESPTKARTFNRIFKIENKKNYFVFATFGHIRDLPADKLAIDYDHSFKPQYEVISKKEKVVAQLKKLAKENDEIILATDLDREGESIAYHTAYLLGKIKEDWPDIRIKDRTPIKRIIFHEITSKAINEALERPQTLRLDLVMAQQARRILDRIVGYELSPLLWKTMGKKWLSAGRVQTVALRLVVEREKEIRKFKTETYFQIYGLFNIKNQKLKMNEIELKAKLVSKDQLPYEVFNKIALFDGEYQFTKTSIDEKRSQSISDDLGNDQFEVSAVREEVNPRFPPPPFTTSLLQQEAFHRFGFSSRMTMKLAQDLYEKGFITYHRTDSFSLSTSFVFKTKDYINSHYGQEYILEKPRFYKTRSRNAQEAHEAIRPTKLNPEIAGAKKDEKLTQNHRRLYELIFVRAVSTQMKEAQVKSIVIDILSGKKYLFRSELFQVVFDGFLRLLNPDYVKNHREEIVIAAGDPIALQKITPEKLETKAPPRYNDASLIKSLEEKGIGRPSTYAPILSLIQDKYYVEKQYRYFIPTKLGEAISDYLSQSFTQVFDLMFTAKMEEGLDQIAENKKNILELLDEFYRPFSATLKIKKKEKTTIDVEETVEEKCPDCGGNLVVRYSRFGKFLACGNYPGCKFTKPFLKYVDNKFCPQCKGRLTIRFTKTKKRFYGCENYPKCKYSAWKL